MRLLSSLNRLLVLMLLAVVGIPGHPRTLRASFQTRKRNDDVEEPGSPTGHHTQEVLAEPRKAQPFKVLAEMPVYRCGGCGKESILSAQETAKLAFKATDQAYRSIDIHPI